MIYFYVLDHRDDQSAALLSQLLSKMDPDRRIVPIGQAVALDLHEDDEDMPIIQSPALVFVHRGENRALAEDRMIKKLEGDMSDGRFYVVYYSTASQEVFVHPRIYRATVNQDDLLMMGPSELEQLALAASSPSTSKPMLFDSVVPMRALATYLFQIAGISPIPLSIDNGFDESRNRELLRSHFEQ